MSTPISVSDSGALSDSPTLFVQDPLATSGTGTESLGGTTTLGASDPASGSEALPISASFTRPDTAAGSEALGAVGRFFTDSASGTQTLTVSGTPSLFAIGLYVSQTGTSQDGGFTLSLPESQQSPYAGTYGGVYGLTWFETIRPPSQVKLVMAPSLGTDLGGAPVVRQYDQQQWVYNRLRPGDYQFLQSLYRLMRRTAGTQFAGRVRIRWPDPETGALVTASGRWAPLPPLSRDVAGFQGLTLTFTNLGRDDTSVTGIWLPSAS